MTKKVAISILFIFIMAVCPALSACVEEPPHIVSAEPDPECWTSRYYVGDPFDTESGFIVTYSDGSVKKVKASEGTVSGFDSSFPGEKPLTITYEGFLFEVTVSVVELTEETFPEIPAPAEPEEGEIPEEEETSRPALGQSDVAAALNRLFELAGRPENLDIGAIVTPKFYQFLSAAGCDKGTFDNAFTALFSDERFVGLLAGAAAEFDFGSVNGENLKDFAAVLLKNADGESLVKLLSAAGQLFKNSFFDGVSLTEFVIREAVIAGKGEEELAAVEEFLSGNKYVYYIGSALKEALASFLNSENEPESPENIFAVEFLRDVTLTALNKNGMQLLNLLSLAIDEKGEEYQLGLGKYTHDDLLSALGALGRSGEWLSALAADKRFVFAVRKVVLSMVEAGYITPEGEFDAVEFSVDTAELIYIADFIFKLALKAEEGIPQEALSNLSQWIMLPSLVTEEVLDKSFKKLNAFIDDVYSELPEPQQEAIVSFLAGESYYSEGFSSKTLEIFYRIIEG